MPLPRAKRQELWQRDGRLAAAGRGCLPLKRQGQVAFLSQECIASIPTFTLLAQPSSAHPVCFPLCTSDCLILYMFARFCLSLDPFFLIHRCSPQSYGHT